ncbi:hypothetical protein CDAR_505121 [Caerostris darwini]|uniref:Uncharacterized protein n=1 Tax=Caerostris darwini TaxID=1538125 RepID=A0AAV4QLV2_9ARAC|nr:hypothetical protein CDAR_505121 [Caerostris darwini]
MSKTKNGTFFSNSGKEGLRELSLEERTPSSCLGVRQPLIHKLRGRSIPRAVHSCGGRVREDRSGVNVQRDCCDGGGRDPLSHLHRTHGYFERDGGICTVQSDGLHCFQAHSKSNVRTEICPTVVFFTKALSLLNFLPPGGQVDSALAFMLRFQIITEEKVFQPEHLKHQTIFTIQKFARVRKERKTALQPHEAKNATTVKTETAQRP